MIALMPRHRLAALAVATGLLAAGCGGGAPARPAPARITVGAFGFPESRVLAELYAQTLQQAGLPVARAADLASREIAEPALEQGVIDVLPEYAGSALAFLTGAPAMVGSNTPAELRAEFGRRGVSVLAPAPAQNQNGLVVTAATAERLRLRRISDLVPVAGDLDLGGPPECPERTYCLQGWRGVYGLSFRSFRPLPPGGAQAAAALETSDVQVAVMFTTDGQLVAGDLVLLTDDRRLQPAENVVPVVRSATLARYGQGLARTLDGVSRRLETADLRELNRRVEVLGEPPERVAADWLRRVGLLPAAR
jgi:osmoprotectant transport system substrate-binding protein